MGRKRQKVLDVGDRFQTYISSAAHEDLISFINKQSDLSSTVLFGFLVLQAKYGDRDITDFLPRTFNPEVFREDFINKFIGGNQPIIDERMAHLLSHSNQVKLDQADADAAATIANEQTGYNFDIKAQYEAELKAQQEQAQREAEFKAQQEQAQRAAELKFQQEQAQRAAEFKAQQEQAQRKAEDQNKQQPGQQNESQKFPMGNLMNMSQALTHGKN